VVWGGQNKNGDNDSIYKIKRKRPYFIPPLTLYHNDDDDDDDDDD
jgi:hypothetical protein